MPMLGRSQSFHSGDQSTWDFTTRHLFQELSGIAAFCIAFFLLFSSDQESSALVLVNRGIQPRAVLTIDKGSFLMEMLMGSLPI